MAREVATPILESEIESSYGIIFYQAQNLPNEFKNLIIAPFLNSLRYGNDLFKLVDKRSYYSNYGQYIELLLKRPDSRVCIAILSDKTVLGWSLVQKNVVHYVWVKKEVRRQGIGRSLLPKEFDTISHITNKGLNIWVNKFPNVRFDPWA